MRWLVKFLIWMHDTFEDEKKVKRDKAGNEIRKYLPHDVPDTHHYDWD